MRKSLLILHVLVACGYVLLSVASMACAVDAGGRHATGHHHSGKLSHSSGCAWACQANPGSSIVSCGFPLKPVSKVVALHSMQQPLTFCPSDHSPVSRGPPPAFPSA